MENVISFQFVHLRKEFPILHELAMYWTTLNQGDLPRRSDIDPRKLEAVLPYLFILDRIDPKDARIRLGSTHLDTLVGAPARGMLYSELIDPSSHDIVAHGLQKLWVKHTPQAFDIKSSFTSGRDTLSGKVILFPLRDVFGRVTKAIGALQVFGRVKYPPYTFDINREPQDIDIKSISKIYQGQSF